MTSNRLRPSPAVRSSLSDDGLVLLDFSGGLVLSSNVVGARIWQLIEQQQTRGDIVRQLAADFDVTPGRADADVSRFVGDLLARGLVIEEEAPSCAHSP